MARVICCVLATEDILLFMSLSVAIAFYINYMKAGFREVMSFRAKREIFINRLLWLKNSVKFLQDLVQLALKR
jgi:hypothetical protein